jgi:PilZ domain
VALNQKAQLTMKPMMTESRRGAFRLACGYPGELEFSGLCTPCTIIDISVTGARVQLTEPGPVPDQVTLIATIGGAEVYVGGTVLRGEPGFVFGIKFDNGERAGLPKLIAIEQRSALAAARGRIPPPVRRRRKPGPIW